MPLRTRRYVGLVAPVAALAMMTDGWSGSRPHRPPPLVRPDVRAPQTQALAHRLVIVLDPGVAVALPSLDTALDNGSLDTTLADGTRVPYNFTSLPGYENLLVWVDSAFAPASGTLVMTSSHLVIAGADVAIPLPEPGDSTILGKIRTLFTASDKVAAYQDYLNEVMRSSRAIGSEATNAIITRAWKFAVDPVRDSLSIRQLQEAIAGKTFDLTVDISPPWSLRKPGTPPNDANRRDLRRRP